LGRHATARKDRLDRGGIDRLADEGTVQIDQVKPLAARSHELHRLRGGIIVEHGGAVHFPLHKAHGLAVFEVDGRIKNHDFGFLS
jgi:hypothetical protein